MNNFQKDLKMCEDEEKTVYIAEEVNNPFGNKRLFDHSMRNAVRRGQIYIDAVFKLYRSDNLPFEFCGEVASYHLVY